uniref:Reverse transcriptase domain-containing protein n=1 Tax=Tanacetum cinerariifolium TaxID=118510 RepID=A0A6L2LCY7_TANCI|nr:reverse transcriptase domain-containing protein [Tanacetum cinerariifolium]
MQTRSFSRLIRDQSSNPTSSTNTNPKGHNRRGSKQRVENSNLEEQFPPVVTMADQRTMAELLRASTEGYKDLLRACPRHGFTEFCQLDTFYNALNPADQDSLNVVAGENLLERSTQDVLTIIKNKSKVCNSRSKLVVSQVKACDVNSNSSEIAKLTHAVNQQTSATQIDMVKNELRNEMKSSIQTSLSNQRNEIKNVMASLLQMNTASTSRSGSLPSNVVAYSKGELKAITTRSGLVIDRPTVPTPPPQSINSEVDERVEETFTDPDLAEYTIKAPPLFKMLKALLSNKEKLQELANTHLNENCSAVILKKLPKKLGDPGKFLIPCGFSELKCKALADLGASINLMPLFVWKKLGLPKLIPTRMTLKLANRAICTPVGIARDVFVPVGKFTFPADFVIVDYESDPRVPFILGRPFLRIARALIDFHGEEMILCAGDERLTLNMRHDTSSYSNQPQKESINLINVFNNLSEDFLEDLFPNQPSGNPTFLPHPELTSPEGNNDIFDSEECNVLSEKLPDLDSTKDLHPPRHDNPLNKYSSLQDSIDPKGLATLADIFVDSIPEMFIDEHALDYSSPLIFDEYDDDFLEVESDARNVHDDPFDSKGEKIEESKLLIDELDLLCDFLPPSEYDSFISQDFSMVDALPSTKNEDKIFNPCILIQEKPIEIITRVVQDKKLAISNASLVLEDFDPSFYKPLFFKEVPKSKMLLPFSSENKEKVCKPGIHTSKKFILILSQNYLIKAIKFSKLTRFSKA